MKTRSSTETTIYGIAMFVSVVAAVAKAQYDGDPATAPQWELLVPALFAMLGLWRARDDNKTSEEVGAKPDVSAYAIGISELTPGEPAEAVSHGRDTGMAKAPLVLLLIGVLFTVGCSSNREMQVHQTRASYTAAINLTNAAYDDGHLTYRQLQQFDEVCTQIDVALDIAQTVAAVGSQQEFEQAMNKVKDLLAEARRIRLERNTEHGPTDSGGPDGGTGASGDPQAGEPPSDRGGSVDDPR